MRVLFGWNPAKFQAFWNHYNDGRSFILVSFAAPDFLLLDQALRELVFELILVTSSWLSRSLSASTTSNR